MIKISVSWIIDCFLLDGKQYHLIKSLLVHKTAFYLLLWLWVEGILELGLSVKHCVIVDWAGFDFMRFCSNRFSTLTFPGFGC